MGEKGRHHEAIERTAGRHQLTGDLKLARSSREVLRSAEGPDVPFRIADAIRDGSIKLLLAHLPVVVWTVDCELRFTASGGAALSTLGLTPTEAVGLSLADFFQTDDPDFLPIAAHWRALAGEDVDFEMDWAGRLFYCHVEPIRDQEGRIVAVVGIGEDVTRRRLLEQQLQQSQTMEAIGRLAGSVSHDFNTYLTVISGFCDLILSAFEKGAPPFHSRGNPVQTYVEEIRKASEKASHLTRQLLTFARRQDLHFEVVDLNTLVSDMQGALGEAAGKSVEVTLELAPELGRVRADPAHLQQSLRSLTVNARDAMPDGGRLTIATFDLEGSRPAAPGSVWRTGPERPRSGPAPRPDARLGPRGAMPEPTNPGSYVVLMVSDTGCGMDEATRTRVFEPFFTTKKRGKGIGLSLATVYGVVQQCDGEIHVRSKPGQGASFFLYLPRLNPALPPSKPVQAVPAGPTFVEKPARTGTIMLVDDTRAVRSLAKTILESAGFRVVEADGGDLALRLAEAHDGAIDLLLTDILMPHMNGWELAERLGPRRPRMKVLYMSGYAPDPAEARRRSAVGARFLQKPFSPDELVDRVRQILSEPDEAGG